MHSRLFLDDTTAVAGGPNVEEVFSTWLYTGTGASQTVTNGIDLSTNGGMVWVKQRSDPGGIGNLSHAIADTARGVQKYLSSNTISAQTSSTTAITAFNSDGFTFGTNFVYNWSTDTYASWTFRKQAKFFDVVTYTGTGVARTISHNLGSAPGCMIIKRLNASGNWQVYHKNLTSAAYSLLLNDTATEASDTTIWNSTAPTSSVFSVGTNADVNASGATYVAYLFASDAGGFGTSGSENIITCGTYTGNGSTSGPSINLGYEPQWLLVKSTSNIGQWTMGDTMRGMSLRNFFQIDPSTSALELNTTTQYFAPTATGFDLVYNGAPVNASGAKYIYIAIRRGPMKTPTAATNVFSPVARSGTGSDATVSSGFVTDMVIEGNRTNNSAATKFGTWDRLRSTAYFNTNTTSAETAAGTTIIQTNPWDTMVGYNVGSTSALTNGSGSTFINWMFRRAPGFFDEVCYTGTGAARTIAHSLGVVPELMIVKRRDTTADWQVYSASLANTEYLVLNTTAAKATGTTRWNSTSPTSTLFTVGTDATVNASGGTYTNYLFASCPGVSKVGSYTGNGSSQTINCGFSAGARFFLVKRTDSTGSWWVYDSARGIIAASDPALQLNNTDAEVTTADAVDTDNTGVIVNQETTCNINVNGATYTYLAIA